MPADILCLNEHWLHAEEIFYFVPEGFTLAGSYCREPPLIRGGSSILVKKDVVFKLIDVSSLCLDFIFEATAIKLTDYDLTVVTIYRTPDSDCALFLSSLEKLIFQLLFKSKPRSKYLAIAGDFNIDILNLHKPETQAFLDILRSFNLYCTNIKPTRNLSCLDNIVINFPIDQCNSSLLGQGILSDHAGVFTKIKNILKSPSTVTENDQEPNTICTRLLTQTGLVNLNVFLNNFDWSDLYIMNDIDIAANYFMNTVINSYNHFCPKITRRNKKGNKSDKKWFTPKLKQMRASLLSLYDIWKSSHSEVDNFRFKQF